MWYSLIFFSENLTSGTNYLKEYISQRISQPVFCGDPVYKLRRVKRTTIVVSSGSKIVKRLRHRKYDARIIERTIGIVLGPSTALYRSFLKHCTLTNKTMGAIWRDLSKPPQRRQGPDLRPLIGNLQPSALGHELVSRLTEHILLWHIFDILFYHLRCLCNDFYGLSALVGWWSSVFIRRMIYTI